MDYGVDRDALSGEEVSAASKRKALAAYMIFPPSSTDHFRREWLTFAFNILYM